MAYTLLDDRFGAHVCMMQAASAGEMDRAARLCTVFTHFCDYNIGMLGSTSQTVTSRRLQPWLMPGPAATDLLLREFICLQALHFELGPVDHGRNSVYLLGPGHK